MLRKFSQLVDSTIIHQVITTDFPAYNDTLGRTEKCHYKRVSLKPSEAKKDKDKTSVQLNI